MKILQTVTLYKWGGEQRKIMLEMEILRELGHEVLLFANPNSQIAEKAEKLGFEVIRQKMTKKNYFITVPKMLKTIKGKNIDLVISHGSTDSWIAAISKIFSSKKVKFYRERHNLFQIKGWLSKVMHRSLFDKILYISQPIKELLLEIGVKEDKLFYLPTIINVEKINATKSTFKEECSIETKYILGTLTSLNKDKGVEEVVQACKIIASKRKDITFVLAGDIEDNRRAYIEEELKDVNFILTGFRKDAVNIMKALDVFIFPSHSEGLGTVLLEAMSAKVPIVCFDKAPMNILVLNDERGYTAKYRDSQALAEKTMELLENKEKQEKFKENAYSFVKENYDRKILLQALETLIKESE